MSQPLQKNFDDEELMDEPPPNTPQEEARYVAMDRVWVGLALTICGFAAIVGFVAWLSGK